MVANLPAGRELSGLVGQESREKLLEGSLSHLRADVLYPKKDGEEHQWKHDAGCQAIYDEEYQWRNDAVPQTKIPWGLERNQEEGVMLTQTSHHTDSDWRLLFE
jgi:hypothetical protein